MIEVGCNTVPKTCAPICLPTTPCRYCVYHFLGTFTRLTLISEQTIVCKTSFDLLEPLSSERDLPKPWQVSERTPGSDTPTKNQMIVCACLGNWPKRERIGCAFSEDLRVRIAAIVNRTRDGAKLGAGRRTSQSNPSNHSRTPSKDCKLRRDFAVVISSNNPLKPAFSASSRVPASHARRPRPRARKGWPNSIESNSG